MKTVFMKIYKIFWGFDGLLLKLKEERLPFGYFIPLILLNGVILVNSVTGATDVDSVKLNTWPIYLIAAVAVLYSAVFFRKMNRWFFVGAVLSFFVAILRCLGILVLLYGLNIVLLQIMWIATDWKMNRINSVLNYIEQVDGPVLVFLILQMGFYLYQHYTIVLKPEEK